ncbi:MAG: HPr(Ser) kinase/phosphatase [Endomicrobiales bacterium]|jgi:HPr kinase/phosphorylase
MPGITIGNILQEKSEDLKLVMVSATEGLGRYVKVSEVNRLGLAFTGYFEHFPQERVQIIGLAEHAYLASLPPDQQSYILEKVFSFPEIPCVIIARNLEPSPAMIAASEKHKIPLIRTSIMTSQIAGELIFYLEDKLAPATNVHGVLVSVYGLGVLIMGEAGIGKSECALELVKRGHMLVADDAVKICQRSGGILVGRGEEIIRHHMEVRGLGIIDVSSMFGVGYTLEEARIELIIRMEPWNMNQEYERVGIDEDYATILKIRVPEITLPVGPGRNLAALVEIASLNQRLKNKGHHSARELNAKLIQMMAKK